MTDREASAGAHAGNRNLATEGTQLDESAEPVPEEQIQALAETLEGQRVLALTGAGISTESGIPDYRGPSSRRRPRRPMQYREFVGSAEARARYWARSSIGWPSVRQSKPNEGHRVLARLERTGLVRGVITQNVDRLHQAAGSRNVIELHGALAEVRCLSCGRLSSRDLLQEKLMELNPGWEARAGQIAPDGDVDLPDELTRGFRVPVCERCGGVLKPHVVYFGENVPKERVEAAWRMFESADVLFVIGSSLTVFSGYRFVDRARKAGKPVAIANNGETRGDKDATVRLDGRLGDILPRLEQRLHWGAS
jgi:NAD-dependent SIR2 family protein deacetylase